jgi:hypothetical protein
MQQVKVQQVNVQQVKVQENILHDERAIYHSTRVCGHSTRVYPAEVSGYGAAALDLAGKDFMSRA